MRHAVEARHDSFRCAEFVALARDKGVAIVAAADPEYPQIADPTVAFVYISDHGDGGQRADGLRGGGERRLGETRQNLGGWRGRPRTTRC